MKSYLATLLILMCSTHNRQRKQSDDELDKLERRLDTSNVGEKGTSTKSPMKVFFFDHPLVQ